MLNFKNYITSKNFKIIYNKLEINYPQRLLRKNKIFYISKIKSEINLNNYFRLLYYYINNLFCNMTFFPLIRG